MSYEEERPSNKRKRSHAQREKEAAELRREQEESLKPANHSFTSYSKDHPEKCFWCKENLSDHNLVVDVSTGVREVRSR